MKLEKFIYYVTPPLLYKIYAKVKLRHRKKYAVSGNQFIFDWSELKTKKLDYFFSEDSLKKFCNALELDQRTNPAVNCSNKENQKYLDDLILNGFCVIRGEYKSDLISQWREKSLKVMEALGKRCDELRDSMGIESMQNIVEQYEGEKVAYELVSGIVRLWGVEKIFKEMSECLTNRRIQDVIGSYFGNNLNESSIYLEYKNKINAFDPNITYHADSPFRQLKAWILLADVGPNNGPFVYCANSHKMHFWRILKDYLNYSQYRNKYNSMYCSFSRMEMAQLSNRYPELVSHERMITGKAGDIIIADTRGVHGGTTLLDGYRLQLGMVYAGLGNPHIEEVTLDF